MADFVAKQGDSLPAWNDTLTYDDDTNTPVDLSGATVNFVMRAQSSTSPVINTAATIIGDPSLGQVAYVPTSTDTATAGEYNASWIVTFGTGGIQHFPTDGYLSVQIQENLESANQTIVELTDLKDFLNIPADDRTHDAELMRFMAGVTPVVEFIVGPVIPRTYNEWYDGHGEDEIILRHRPVLSLTSVTIYIGPVAYPLTIVANPAVGTTYSVELNQDRIVRRTTGGGRTSFPSGEQSVNVAYTAGRSAVPQNVRLATLNLIAFHYQTTQQSGRPVFGSSSPVDDEPGLAILGFFVPNSIREQLAPNRRFPSLA